MRNTRFYLLSILILLLISGCGGGSGDGPRIYGIFFDPPEKADIGSDVLVTASVVGTDLEFHWTVEHGFLRQADYHSGQSGPGLPEIAVTPSGHDNVGTVITSLGLEYDTLSLDLLDNGGVLDNYDAIFINSSDTISVVGPEPILSNWVQDGGALYASGNAADYLIGMDLNPVVFAEPSPYIGVKNHSDGTLYAHVADLSMSDTTGVTLADIQYPDYPWAPVIDTNWPAKVLIEADASWVVNTGSVTNLPDDLDLTTTPMSVLVPYGDGEIIFTNFHYHSGMNHQESALVRYIAALPVTWSITKDSQELISLSGFQLYRDFIGIIREDQEITKTFDIDGFDSVIMVFNAASGLYEIDLTGPGDITREITTPVPISMTFPEVEPGTWNVKITATDTGSIETVPYVLSVGGKSATTTIITHEPRVIWTMPDYKDIFTIHLKVIDGEMRTDEWLSGIKTKIPE